MSNVHTISFSEKEVNCFGRMYPLGQLFIDFLVLDLSEYEAKRLKIMETLKENNEEHMESLTKLSAKELKRGFKGLAFEQLGITDDMPLKNKYTVYSIYKALLPIEHKYFNVLNYPSLSSFAIDEVLERFDLISLQKRYKEAMEKCLLKDDTDLTAIQRFRENECAIEGRAELVFEVSDDVMYEVFMASDISSLLYIEFMRMLQNNVFVSKCANCQRYFIPKGNYDMKYCEREVDGVKVCQKLGAVIIFKDKVRNNPIYNEYERVYKRFYARKRKGLMTQKQFDEWLKKASKLKKDALEGILSTEDFKRIIADI